MTPLIPLDLDAEAAVIGGIMLAPDSLADVADAVRPEDFSALQFRVVFAAMLALHERGVPLDFLTLTGELKSAGTLEDAGGSAAVAGLDGAAPWGSNGLLHAKMVHAAAVRRRLVSAAADIDRMARDPEVSVERVLGDAEALMLGVGQDLASGRDVVTVGPMLRDEVFPAIERRWQSGSTVTGTRSGFRDLDSRLTGLHAGELIIVAGRPSMGKTSLMMNMAAHIALRENGPVLVFSLEMPKAQLLERLLSAEARVDSQRVRTGRLDERDWPKLAQASDGIYRAKMAIRDDPGLDVFKMRAIARRTKRKFGGLALIGVDYIQLMDGNGDNREQEIAGVSRGLKVLARELDCPVIALSQLNRSVEKRPDKRPMMSDLRESGAIEQDADVIAFVYRDEVYDKNSKDKGIAEIIVAKQRNGPVGTVRVAFSSSLTRFDDLAADDERAGGEWG